MCKKKKVLIIDDEKPFSDELKMMFEMPPEEGGYEFEVSQAFNLDEACHCLKGYPLNWDVFIIDRRFQEKRNGNDFWATLVLESLLDLGAKGIKIILTAYTEEENMKRCFQLGAWDYIDKKSMDDETCFEKTVQSAILGLKYKERIKIIEGNNIKVARWYKKYSPALLFNPNKFIALQLTSSKNNMWDIIKNDKGEPFVRESLYRLYGDLDTYFNDLNKPWEDKTRKDIAIIPFDILKVGES